MRSRDPRGYESPPSPTATRPRDHPHERDDRGYDRIVHHTRVKPVATRRVGRLRRAVEVRAWRRRVPARDGFSPLSASRAASRLSLLGKSVLALGELELFRILPS